MKENKTELRIRDKFKFSYSDTMSEVINIVDTTVVVKMDKPLLGSPSNVFEYDLNALKMFLGYGLISIISSVDETKCKHEFKLYEGFTDIFEYCVKCNEKKR